MLTLTKPLSRIEAPQALIADARLRSLAPDLRPAHLATWSEEPVLVQDRSHPWLLTPLESDPLRRASGGYPLPSDVIRQLRALAATGAGFDRIAIAHEVESSTTTLKLLAKSKGWPVVLSHREAAVVLGPLPAPPTAVKATASVDAAFRKALKAPGAVAALAGGAFGSALDPIVFGVLGVGGPPTPGRAAMYYPLAAWSW